MVMSPALGGGAAAVHAASDAAERVMMAAYRRRNGCVMDARVYTAVGAVIKLLAPIARRDTGDGQREEGWPRSGIATSDAAPAAA